VKKRLRQGARLSRKTFRWAKRSTKHLQRFFRRSARAVLKRYFPVFNERRNFSRIRKRKAQEMLPLISSPIFNREAKLIYLHVPKTAGKAFTSLCEQTYPGATAVHTNGRYNNEEWTAARVIGGHFHYSCFAAAGPQHVFLGVVRDPVERALSRFRWYSHRPQGRESREERGFDHESFSNTLANDAFRMEFLHNLQCRYLSDCSRFRDALKVLQSRPFIIGTFEQLDQWMDVLAEEFGWPHRALPVVNRLTTEKPASDNSELLALLRKYNKEDQRLYEFVRKQGVFSSLPADYDRKVFLPPAANAASNMR